MTRKQFIFSLVRVICYVLLLAAALALIFSPLPEYTRDSDEIDAGAQLAQGLGTALLAIFFVVFKFFVGAYACLLLPALITQLRRLLLKMPGAPLYCRFFDVLTALIFLAFLISLLVSFSAAEVLSLVLVLGGMAISLFLSVTAFFKY